MKSSFLIALILASLGFSAPVDSTEPATLAGSPTPIPLPSPVPWPTAGLCLAFQTAPARPADGNTHNGGGTSLPPDAPTSHDITPTSAPAAQATDDATPLPHPAGIPPVSVVTFVTSSIGGVATTVTATLTLPLPTAIPGSPGQIDGSAPFDPSRKDDVPSVGPATPVFPMPTASGTSVTGTPTTSGGSVAPATITVYGTLWLDPKNASVTSTSFPSFYPPLPVDPSAIPRCPNESRAGDSGSNGTTLVLPVNTTSGGSPGGDSQNQTQTSGEGVVNRSVDAIAAGLVAVLSGALFLL